MELGNHGHLKLDSEVTAVIAAMDLHISFSKEIVKLCNILDIEVSRPLMMFSCLIAIV